MTPVSTTVTYTFGIALKRARRAAHLTQAELAERAGFSVVYIPCSNAEHGSRNALQSPCSSRRLTSLTPTASRWKEPPNLPPRASPHNVSSAHDLTEP